MLALLALGVLTTMTMLQSTRGAGAREWVGDLLRLGRKRSTSTTSPSPSSGGFPLATIESEG